MVMIGMSSLEPGPWLALDVGGANLKLAHQAGPARSVPFEVWKRPAELGRAIAAAAATVPAFGRVALTMTAELCDCYATKAAGVGAVLDAVGEAARGAPVVVWGVDGAFHTVDAARERPALVAAANWLALATVAARLVAPASGVLIDIGSTTTDLIPLDRGASAARGRSDVERLQNGELVYAGVRRTPLCALAAEIPFRGRPTGLAAEIFASTLDVYLILGNIPSAPADLSTADGRPATPAAARDRLARMICMDRDGFTEQDALEFAQAADRVLLDRLAIALDRACSSTIGRPAAVVVSGSGEFLARRLAARAIEPGAAVVSLRDAWGPAASSAGCAHALLVLAMESAGEQEHSSAAETSNS